MFAEEKPIHIFLHLKREQTSKNYEALEETICTTEKDENNLSWTPVQRREGTETERHIRTAWTHTRRTLADTRDDALMTQEQATVRMEQSDSKRQSLEIKNR